jgi:hypothetical protein
VVAEAITSALTVATIMAEGSIMGTATSIAAITMRDLPIGTMIIIADFGTALGTSTASVRAGGGLTTTKSMCGFAATTTNCVIVYPARGPANKLGPLPLSVRAPVDLFRGRSESGRESTWGCIALNSREVPVPDLSRCSIRSWGVEGKSGYFQT